MTMTLLWASGPNGLSRLDTDQPGTGMLWLSGAPLQRDAAERLGQVLREAVRPAVAPGEPEPESPPRDGLLRIMDVAAHLYTAHLLERLALREEPDRKPIPPAVLSALYDPGELAAMDASVEESEADEVRWHQCVRDAFALHDLVQWEARHRPGTPGSAGDSGSR